MWMKNEWKLILKGMMFILIGNLVFSCQQNKRTDNKHIEQDTVVMPPPPPVLKYGFPVDSFELAGGTVKPNQNLSSILNRYNVDLSTIDKIARNSKDVFDVRKIKSGNLYTFFLSQRFCSATKIFCL